MGRLTTHVLDTAAGRPAAGVRIKLYNVDRDTRSLVTSVETNDDGRVDRPLAEGDAFGAGIWELTFFAGDYLRESGHTVTEPPFLDEITIRFGIASPDEHYHVPLLLSPYGYSTYRGS